MNMDRARSEMFAAMRQNATDPAGIIQPLRTRIAQLEKDYETMRKIAQGEIDRLKADNERLRMALTAMSPPARVEP